MPMETVTMIPGELEHLESLVKVARKKKDAEAANTQVSMVSIVLTFRHLCINKTHRSKTLYLSVEVNHYLIEGLVDTRASMSIMAVSVVRELGLMHLVSGSETYKTASSAVTQALGRIEEMPVKRSDSRTDGRDGTQKHEPRNPDEEEASSLLFRQGTNERRGEQESESDSDSNESSDEGILLVGPDEGVFDFGNIEFEDLIQQMEIADSSGDVKEQSLKTPVRIHGGGRFVKRFELIRSWKRGWNDNYGVF
ncbi:unnamed protein product [Sphagnum troendelagicum]|uniref:Uncharacterized protein n=1 Tax=Sphagnum troendelagicum TaxID=128251 RepID=A0ABP0TE79_9BRYO